MTPRKSKKQLAIEAEQDARYKALSDAQRDALQNAISQAVHDHDAKVEASEFDLWCAQQDLVDDIRLLRSQWSSEIVDAAMRDPVAETTLQLVPDFPGCIEDAEREVAKDDAELAQGEANALMAKAGGAVQ